MPANPIQKRTRNALLLGMLIMLLIAIVVVAILYFVLFRREVTDAMTKKEGGTAYAYKLTSSVKSGEEITMGKLEPVKMYVDDLPGDYNIGDINSETYKSKVDLQAGTILSLSLLNKDDEIKDSTRLMEYNMITLPSTLRQGDYIDVRFTMPSGEDFIVLSQKEIVSLQNTTVGMYLTEDEILMMSSAIIESYIMTASDLHAVQYVEAGNQKASQTTYSVNSAVAQLIKSNYDNEFNIEDVSKINAGTITGMREVIEQELQKYTGMELPNIEQGITEQKETAMELYLSGLAGY